MKCCGVSLGSFKPEERLRGRGGRGGTLDILPCRAGGGQRHTHRTIRPLTCSWLLSPVCTRSSGHLVAETVFWDKSKRHTWRVPGIGSTLGRGGRSSGRSPRSLSSDMVLSDQPVTHTASGFSGRRNRIQVCGAGRPRDPHHLRAAGRGVRLRCPGGVPGHLPSSVRHPPGAQH